MTYAPPVAAPGLILHQAFFWLKNPGSETDRAALIAGLRTLGDIPQVRNLSISISARTESRDVVDSSFDVVETMLFNSLEDQRNYQPHPIHLAFIAACGHLWERVVVYDNLIV
jgi:Stress responsive A/B Barrel Domain